VSGASVLLAHVERAADVAASELAAALELGVIGYRDAEPLATGNEEPAGVDGGWRHDFAALLGCEPLARRERAPDPGAPAVIFFTSGSTGPAKGVTHSGQSVRWMIAAAAAAFGLDASGVVLPGCSMSHLGAFLWALATLSVGGGVVAARSTDGHELLPLLRERRPTILAMIPAALSALVHDHDLRPGDFCSLRMCRAGADKVSTELLSEFAAAAGFPIVEGYGMTEVGLATLNPPSGEIRQGSIGRPIHGFAIALREEHPLVRGRRRAGRAPRRLAGRRGRRPRRGPRRNVRAFVTRRNGVEPPSRADLIVFCREHIGYKAPDEIVFLDKMPLNPTGKIDRDGLKRMAEDHLQPHGLSR
jgi:long-chain acyl-CoA synthetase